MDRLTQFEEMLNELKKQAKFEEDEMARLKAEGKEKTATYRQYFGNKMIYSRMLDLYKKHGLL